ncbi:MAG TPA: ABC transporter ATP-binding protein, partial [Usitatibacter sp.]|nr:ABC transporter ATP-binding protein [Usitatibacter sp.]
MAAAIQVAGLSKCYDIRHENREKYVALRDVLAARFRSLVSGGMHSRSGSVEQFWALRDVTFDVNPGDRIGIIGRNGAGKSTLLKLLSRITEPSRGRIGIAGRVASLLEVGTGFHPELTGRENIFLNGVILGMKRSEIRRHFDEIVAFAEIERFLDTPVKRYSSGMYVRLAFAVAAHLEAEILIVDEVLAVGDAAFQEKCLSKMRNVTSSGRTVLFVSHNMAAIKRLCERSMLIERGEVVHDGPTSGTVEEYERRNVTSAGSTAAWERSGSGRLRLESVTVEDADRPGVKAIPFNGSLEITLKGRTGPARTSFGIAFQIMT